MTKKSKNAFIVVFAFICLLSIFLSGLVFPEVKADTQVNYKKKIVSVVFDNSGSMLEGNRPELAKYSLQMLVSMLGKEDELIVCPMNYKNNDVVPIIFDLTKGNRESEIQQKIINNNVLEPNGGTPAGSIDEALNELKNRGLKLGQEIDGTTEQNVEYWLVMLTDGAFSGYSTSQKTSELIESKIQGYAGLNTVYLSFGSGAVDLSSPDLSLNKNYPFNAYYVPNATELVDSMKKVANKILGKYGAESNFAINNNKVTINVGNFDFAMNSITIFAQDCGAVISSITLNGKSITPQLYNKLANCGLAIQEGYLAVIKDADYMSGGQLEIVFDKPVSDVSILVEPALHIDAYLEYFDGSSWKKTDMQYINSHMMPGDTIRVGYKVFSSADNKEVDTKSIFGEHIEKVTYCGKGYGIEEEIELQVGANELFVSIVVLDGAYTMQSSLTCYIEKNPTFYRIESNIKSLGGKKSELEYKVFVDDKQISYADFAKYDWLITAKDPNGNEINLSKILGQNGIISVSFDGEGREYGNYTFEAKVINKESKVSRTVTDIIQVSPSDVKVNCLTTDSFTTTKFLIEQGAEKKVEFALKLEGKDETFERNIINYDVTINGKDVTSKTTIENGNLVFNISKGTLEDLSIGNYQIKVNVDTLGGVSDQAQYDFNITDSAYVIQQLDIGTNEFDRYDVSKAGAGVYFAVYKDGKTLTVEQLSQALENKEIVVDYDPLGWVTLLPCALNVVVEQRDGQAILACKVVSDIFSPLDDLLGSFIFDNEEKITVKVGKATCSTSFIITEVSFMSRVIRWIIMILIILLILHLLLFALGFIIAKPLPKGTLLNLNVDEQNMGDTVRIVRSSTVNLNKEILLWHLSRLIPLRELKNQKPKIISREIEFSVDKVTKGAVCKFKSKRKRCLIKYKDFVAIKAQAKPVQEAIQTCRRGKKPPRNLKLTKKEFMKVFNQTKTCVKNEGLLEMGTWYGIHLINDNGTIGNRVGFYIFIQKNLK